MLRVVWDGLPDGQVASLQIRDGFTQADGTGAVCT